MSVSFLATTAFVGLPLQRPALAQTALPTAGTIASGTATISAPNANSLVINQTSRTAIINWGGFSIGQGNSVRFENGSGATLNRVTGFSRSQIDGALSATGSVYLVNPNGITVGPSGTVTTGGSFVASTHDITDAAFTAGGDLTFRGTSTASVINYGTIGALGGDVALIARKVENAGSITAPDGTVGLAAGYEVLVRDAALSDGKFVVKVGGGDTEAKTSGVIRAAEVELRANGGNVYALAGNTESLTKATGVASRGGRIFLTAGDGGTVEASQKVAARAATTGGKAKGGTIRASGDKVKLSGTLDAQGARDAGGTIVVTAREIQLAGGANLDASGTTGGLILVGGDYQGGAGAIRYSSETLATAQTVTVDADAMLRADGTAGAGGKLVVWSDEATSFAGTISARGAGAAAGGDAEVSGKAWLDFSGMADLRSERGTFGTLLLDPYNLTISNAASSGMSGFDAGANDSVLNVTTLTNQLNLSNVVVTTGASGAQAGNITVTAPISWNSGSSLMLSADAATGGIFINGAITGSNGGGLILSAGSGGISQTALIAVSTLRVITANGGAVNLNNAGNQIANLGASSTAGNFDLITNASMTVSGAVTSGTGHVWLTSIGGNLTVNAALGSSAANADYSLKASSTLTIAKDISLTGASASLTLLGGASYALTNGARVTLPDASASLSIDGAAYTLIRDVTALQNMTLNGRYALGTDIDATATAGWNAGAGFLSIGYSIGFTGTLAGLGHTIDGLTIHRPGMARQGLFGYLSGTARDLTLSNVSITSVGVAGALAGRLDAGTVRNVHATGSVTSVLGGSQTGGLIGWQDGGSITGSSSTVAVTGVGETGGLVGRITGSGVISNSYATGSVTSTGSSTGGLVGEVLSGATLTNVYASGRVTGTTNVGGLVGAITGGTVSATNAYWDSDSTGQASSLGGGGSIVGVTRLTDATARTASSYGFDFTDMWVIIDGETRPMLRSEYSTVIYTSHALQLMALDLSADYRLGTDLNLTAAFTADAGGNYADVWGGSGFVSVGNNASHFTGDFDGQGHTLTGLMINRSGTSYVGLFGYVSNGALSNLTLSGASIVSGNAVGGLAGYLMGSTISNITQSGGSIVGGDYVGGLVGYLNGGTLGSVSTSATVTGNEYVGGLAGSGYQTTITEGTSSGSVTATGDYAGGLVGFADNGSGIALSSASGSVSGTGGSYGGLVGRNGGAITQSWASGTVISTVGSNLGGLVGENHAGSVINQSYATGAVSGSSARIGGFVGLNSGEINDSYAMGAVTGGSVASAIGGFVGWNNTGGVIRFAYSTGYVRGSSLTGGFAGVVSDGGIDYGYWDVSTSGQSTGIGTGTGVVFGRSTGDLQDVPLTGFSPAIWGMGANLYPYFRWQHATTPQAVSGIAYSNAGTTALTGAIVTAVTGGTALGSASTGANGYYYILAPAGSIGSSGVLTYIDNNAVKGVAFSDVAGTNGVQNVAIHGNAAHIITGQSTLSATQGNYLATRGLYADTDLAFLSASSFAPLTTTAGYAVKLNASGNYTLDGNLGSGGALTLSSGGTFGVSGTVALAAAGALTLSSPVAWSNTASLSLTTTGGIGNGMTLGAITAANGTLSLSSSGIIIADGAVNMGTFRLTAGHWQQFDATLPAFHATDFRLTPSASFLRATAGDGSLLTPYVIADVYGLQGMASHTLAASNFNLGADIDASGTAGWNAGAGFLGIGDDGLAFSGTLNGQNHAITGLTINRPTGTAGLFGDLEGAVSNLTLSGTVTGATAGLLAAVNTGTVTSVFASGSVSTGSGNGPAVTRFAGGLIGLNAGTVTNSYAAVTVTAGDYAYAGGLVALNAAAMSGGVITSTGTITGSAATGAVTVGADGAAGGLVGYNTTAISGSYATGAVSGGANAHVGGLVGDNQIDSLAGTTGSITTSFAGGTVTAGTGITATAGGLAGVNAGSISDAYAVGTIIGGQVSGGLVGVNSGSIARAYATGTVPSASAPFGGLVGNNSGAISASFWNTTTSGTSRGVGLGSASGVTGLNTAQMSSLATYTAAGWTIDDAGGTGATWRIYDGQTAPLLRTFLNALTVTGGSGTKTYDGSATTGNVGTLTYSPTGHDGTLVLGTATYTASSADAGSYSGAGLTLGGLYSTQFGYDITTVAGSLTVNQALLTVTANGRSMTYGNSLPTLTYAITSGTLYGADTLTGALATTASSTANVGTYGITQGTLAASSNYTLTYVGANVAVTPRALTVTADGKSMVYGNAVPGLTYAVTSGSLVNGDSLTGMLATLASSTSNVGTYGITQGTLAASSNYTLTYAGANVAVTPRALTVTADGKSMVYGNAVPGLTYAVTSGSLVNGDSLTGMLATLASSTSNVGTYGITQGTLAASSNYALTYVGANVTVTPRAITVTADGKSMVYGNAVPGLTYAITSGNLVNGDSLTGALATLASSTSNVGTYGITQGTLAASSNYALTYVGANVTVTPRALTVTADGKSMVYGNAVPGLTYAITSGNLVNGDSLTGLLATLASSTSNVGAYGITQGTLAASSNYALTYVGANVAITPSALTVTAHDATRAAGAPNPVFTYTLGGDGLVNGDTLTGQLDTTATMASPAGDYAILQGTLAASANYAVSYVPGVLSVTSSPTPPVTPGRPDYIETSVPDQFMDTLDTRWLLHVLDAPLRERTGLAAECATARVGCPLLPVPSNLQTSQWLSFRGQ
ncbi:beta strand repeat-containing protein [Xanthobacteraceae bacterium A53D]